MKWIKAYKNWLKDTHERLIHIENKIDDCINQNDLLKNDLQDIKVSHKSLFEDINNLEKLYSKSNIEITKRLIEIRERLIHIENKENEILGYTRENEFKAINQSSSKEYLSIFPDSFINGKHTLFSRNKAYYIKKNTDNNLKDYSRLLTFTLNIEKVISDNIEGSLAELGVYKGSNAAFMARYATENDRKMYIIDTFEGFSEEDISGIDSCKSKQFEDTSLEAVKEFCGEGEGIIYVKGYFPESVTKELEDDQFSFVSLDCDLYKPIRAGLEFFYPRLNKGGMIFIHDYSSGYWEGCTQAVNEFCDENELSVVLMPDKSGTAVIVR
ncbi:Macrocin-O-methyltransferase (TylF) [Pseudobutyrivibrio ruminis]|uniref:Macrocin-O-methyltransferase (TylF) n=1 Tax=Pseudobutyrivibrio ruminis TaxID=46206 RepID=A0A1H7F979_9FIRM|nr:TylF/MycF/NovP-related O-methyltransferase [Pseudobutyrivibrio ruminis]SEK21897.1 Macrocin-O-methyltransferase (TylF) [Pseudobutyrivibrio ruminis]